MRFATLLLALGLASVAEASLQWERMEAELKPALGEAAVEAVFPFRNSGSTPVRIAQVTSSCGCTVPKLSKDTYAPGESGEIRAKFTIGARQGRQDSTVTVITDDAMEPRTLLRLRIDIPTPVEILPRVVYWTVGEAPEPKALEVRVHPTLEVKFKEVRALSEGFSTELKPGTEPHTWLVEIRPVDTQSRRRATFELVTEAPVPGAGALTLFAFVR